jgi:hypothetical protein
MDRALFLLVEKSFLLGVDYAFSVVTTPKTMH